MYFWIVLLIISLGVLHASFVLGTYQCNMKTLQLNCSGVSQEDISGETLAIVNKPDIDLLNITNSHIAVISATTFEGFSALQSIYVTGSNISQIDEGSFTHITGLQYLDLSNNALTKVDFQLALPGAALKYLNLSNNLLQDISNFNSTYFSKLQLLDLSNNQLSHLPMEVLKKLDMVNDFVIIIDNNPWDCSHPVWSENLNSILLYVFCAVPITETIPKETTTTRRETMTEATQKKTTTLQPLQDRDQFVQAFDNKTASINETHGEKSDYLLVNCYKCSFYFCLLWMFVGIWIGIILGNVGKIHHLICHNRSSYEDKYTQCEYSLVEHHVVSGIFNSNTRKFTPVSALGTSMPNIVSMDKT
ncbi:SLIT and NTRK-like protein 2 isoform X2 [Euwallacea similis]|uniref:SLIT and NTRK-like protein 2 isoform X2 n=1 Tax=Euwallacea similis TaxID=1736056 RepID=UPI00344FC0FC